MPDDVDYIRQLLKEVRDTTGRQSAKKADELLRYVTRDRDAVTTQDVPLKPKDGAALPTSDLR